MSVSEGSSKGVSRQHSQALLPGLTMPLGTNLGKEDVAQEVERIYIEAEEQRYVGHKGSVLADVLNISSVLTDAAEAMVDDSFSKCFKSMPADPWNWNFYLFTMWLVGVVFRYCILFPIRLVLLLSTLMLFFIMFFTVQAVVPKGPFLLRIEQRLIRFQCGMFVASWTGVIRFHGPRPMPGPGRIWVANHTSMIDYIILSSYSAFAVIMQLHPGWVGFLQTKVLHSLGCLWFNRTQVKDRTLVATRMREHVHSANSTPLLVFPEGTCVNNEYCVMFKRGAFEMDATVHPIAIKYNKIFVDAFWNSRRQSFTQHLLKLMTSWAVVCDVYFLEPQRPRPGETTDAFAARVQAMIANQAKLRVVPWDGYLKYYNLGEKHPGLIEKRRKVFADQLRKYLPHALGSSSSSGGAIGNGSTGHGNGGSMADGTAAGQLGSTANAKKVL